MLVVDLDGGRRARGVRQARPDAEVRARARVRARADHPDTDDVAPAERTAYWRHVVSQAFVPLVPVPRLPDGAFAGRLERAAVGRASVCRVTSRAQSVRRGPAELAHGGQALFVNLQLHGSGTARQDGRAARLEAGDVVVVDSRRPFRLDYEDDFEQVTFAVAPGDALGWLAPPPGTTARRLPAPTAGAVREVLGVALRDDVARDRALGVLLADQVCQLVSHGLRRLAGGGDRRDLVAEALRLVEVSADDPALRPADLAARLHVSVRTLQQAFAEVGSTPRAALLERRLAGVRADLEDPAADGLGVAQVGLRHGLADPSVLARAYRRRYGCSPSDTRDRAAARRGRHDRGPVRSDQGPAHHDGGAP